MRTPLLLVLAAVLALGAVGPAAAQSTPGSGNWSPGPDATGDNTYAGFVDQPADGSALTAGSAFHVSGWVVDTTAQGWAGIDGLSVYLGAGTGGQLLARGDVAENRPDVAAATGNGFWAASGFDALVPAGAVPAGSQTLTVAVHTAGKGTWVRQVGVNVGGGGGGAAASAPAAGGPVSSALTLTILSPGSNEDIPGTNNGIIHGVAGDTRTRAELGAGVDRIQVYLDARRGLAGSQFIGDATITGNTWSLNWAPTKYNAVRHHVMYVYARSAVTGEELLVTQEINISS